MCANDNAEQMSQMKFNSKPKTQRILGVDGCEMGAFLGIRFGLNFMLDGKESTVRKSIQRVLGMFRCKLNISLDFWNFVQDVSIFINLISDNCRFETLLRLHEKYEVSSS